MTKTHRSKALLALPILLLTCFAPAAALSNIALQLSASSAQTATLELDLTALDAFDQVEFTTTTIWTDGAVTFTGVPLKTLLLQLRANGQTVEMVALNDYTVTMPISELEDDVPIVATRINGAPMSVRDKGPFWVVFPYDRDVRYKTETAYSRSIWQLNRLRVTD